MKNDYLHFVSMDITNYEYHMGVEGDDIFFLELKNIPSKQASKSWYHDLFDTSKPLFYVLRGL